eukprot:365457-Chlamydomonas_euryale.AAC.6
MAPLFRAAMHRSRLSVHGSHQAQVAWVGLGRNSTALVGRRGRCRAQQARLSGRQRRRQAESGSLDWGVSVDAR